MTKTKIPGAHSLRSALRKCGDGFISHLGPRAENETTLLVQDAYGQRWLTNGQGIGLAENFLPIFQSDDLDIVPGAYALTYSHLSPINPTVSGNLPNLEAALDRLPDLICKPAETSVSPAYRSFCDYKLQRFLLPNGADVYIRKDLADVFLPPAAQISSWTGSGLGVKARSAGGDLLAVILRYKVD